MFSDQEVFSDRAIVVATGGVRINRRAQRYANRCGLRCTWNREIPLNVGFGTFRFHRHYKQSCPISFLICCWLGQKKTHTQSKRWGGMRTSHLQVVPSTFRQARLRWILSSSNWLINWSSSMPSELDGRKLYLLFDDIFRYHVFRYGPIVVAEFNRNYVLNWL